MNYEGKKIMIISACGAIHQKLTDEFEKIIIIKMILLLQNIYLYIIRIMLNGVMLLLHGQYYIVISVIHI
ncbi:MAG: hypothetical protein CI948_1974 [Halanaerobium sp.]|jgi:hypothetical protein|nr:MAG: hypothetical protein CI948_1974 [Halanaerobium sp.]